MQHSKPIPLYTAQYFEDLGMSLVGREKTTATHTKGRRFKAFFHQSPVMCSYGWRHLVESGWLDSINRPEPKHYLWTMMFLKLYGTEEVNASRVGCDEKTFRKWVWFYAEGIANLDKVFVSVVCMLS